jgi:hypothetical protein
MFRALLALSPILYRSEIAKVFCVNEETFSMDQIDAGKIVGIRHAAAIPV